MVPLAKMKKTVSGVLCLHISTKSHKKLHCPQIVRLRHLTSPLATYKVSGCSHRTCFSVRRLGV